MIIKIALSNRLTHIGNRLWHGRDGVGMGRELAIS